MAMVDKIEKDLTLCRRIKSIRKNCVIPTT